MKAKSEFVFWILYKEKKIQVLTVKTLNASIKVKTEIEVTNNKISVVINPATDANKSEIVTFFNVCCINLV